MYPLVRFLEDCCTVHARTEKERQEDAARQLKELYHLRRAMKTWLITRKMKNVRLMDPLACLGAANNTAVAMGILKDGIHLKGTHMGKVAYKIKELVSGWVRSKKRAGYAIAGGDEKRPRLAEPRGGGGLRAKRRRAPSPGPRAALSSVLE